MNNFNFQNPVKIIFGKNTVSSLSDEIKPFGSKVLMIYGKGSIKTNGIYNLVKNQLKGFEILEFSGIEPNPRVETIRNIKNQAIDFKPDFILAVGGGSVIDATKLLASSIYYNGDPWDFLTNENTEPEKYIPFGVVLTISATGSEMNNGSVITDWKNHQKLFFSKKQTYPQFSILDPEFTYSVSKEHTAYGIIDAFSHVLEQYIVTSMNTPLQDRYAEGILLTLIENSQKVLIHPEDFDARANIMFCACMALNNLISSGTNEDWATHAIEHEISAIYDIPHAAGLAILTPHWLNEVKYYKIKKIAHYGRRVWNLVGSDDELVDKAIECTAQFFRSLGVKMKLSEWGIDSKEFDNISELLSKREIGELPLSKDNILNILNNSL